MGQVCQVIGAVVDVRFDVASRRSSRRSRCSTTTYASCSRSRSTSARTWSGPSPWTARRASSAASASSTLDRRSLCVPSSLHFHQLLQIRYGGYTAILMESNANLMGFMCHVSSDGVLVDSVEQILVCINYLATILYRR